MVVALGAALVAGTPVRAQAGAPRAPVVLAAASLQEALSAAAAAWARRGHPRPVLSFAASSALARQVEAGAPADLFLSADEDWMTYLDRRGLLRRGSRVALLGNTLVLVAPATRPLRLAIAPGFPLARTLGPGRLAMADPDSVPAGKYGREALTALGVWSQVEGRVVRAENVRAALALVARGEAPLGIVFATDARATPAVRVVGVFPSRSHAPIIYPLAALARSTNPEGEGFRRFLLGSEARAIFRRHGFTLR
ncbi:molybdate ABC transporter substrate-binding protein [Novosphingobium piscinae]|uniref:Molybdate ABC transporter substrate-binding protein n=1 Tax=Novosphingobium piscinae TaxID=1507448 RepID=A0A7X1KPJ6_9SPHN|nr:molybdate ABC transporter substrate-binding protein [Novosphingobium piscinae]